MHAIYKLVAFDWKKKNKTTKSGATENMIGLHADRCLSLQEGINSYS